MIPIVVTLMLEFTCSGAARQQLADNAKKYNEIRETMNAYKTHVCIIYAFSFVDVFCLVSNISSLFQAPPWLRRGDSGKKKERQEDDYGLNYEPFKSGSE